MTREIVPLDDGSVLLLDETRGVTPPADEGVLSGEVVHFVIEAIAGGVTFEALKHVAAQLTTAREPRAATADDVRDAVRDYLLRSGYIDIQVTELRSVGDRGWTITGTADADPFHALSDPTGRVVHVRLG